MTKLRPIINSAPSGVTEGWNAFAGRDEPMRRRMDRDADRHRQCHRASENRAGTEPSPPRPQAAEIVSSSGCCDTTSGASNSRTLEKAQ